jgi:hypothetical protein
VTDQKVILHIFVYVMFSALCRSVDRGAASDLFVHFNEEVADSWYHYTNGTSLTSSVAPEQGHCRDAVL